jgi:hypothetical protein
LLRRDPKYFLTGFLPQPKLNPKSYLINSSLPGGIL